MNIRYNNSLVTVPLRKVPALVIGSGAAGLSAAVHIKRGGGEVTIVTDNVNGGTSRNTGSDKQTYYKLSDASLTPDSPYDMAKSYLVNGCAHGDITLAEAAGSNAAFYNLVSMGVDFPSNRYGGFTGYKTDHDASQRGVSLGPFTSREMVRRLRKETELLGIPLLDRHEVVKLLVQKDTIVGAILLDKLHLQDPSHGLEVMLADHVVMATGGPAGMYQDSVYPKVHTGAIGLALEVGAQAVNLTESQFGIASTKFRWNLSGSYQQVVPHYFSTDEDGCNKEDFLLPYFENWESLTQAIFLKGYQWPFDAKKISDNGSSLIDLLVYHERVVRNRRVFMDFRSNLTGKSDWPPFSMEVVAPIAREYLQNSQAYGETPLERLMLLNPAAVSLYEEHHVDLASEPLEIAVCAQHNNGGLAADIWWESTTVSHLYPIGELNGSHGVSRPGGSALNAGQVGAKRASQLILHRMQTEAPFTADIDLICKDVQDFVNDIFPLVDDEACGSTNDVRDAIRVSMSACAGPLRTQAQVRSCLEDSRLNLGSYRMKVPSCRLPALLKVRHMLIARYCYLAAILEYLEHGGGSRGSFLVADPNGVIVHPLLPQYMMKPADSNMAACIQQLCLNNGIAEVGYVPCRPIPTDSFWFETVWAEYREGKIYR